MKTKSTIFLVIAFCVMTMLRLQAQVPDFEWAVRCGGDSNIYVNSMAIDPDGNQVYTGVFIGTIDFDPDPVDEFPITSNGQEDIFILKLHPDGSLFWAAGMGDAGSDYGNGVVTDASGNIYTTGYFNYSMDADPSAVVYMLTQTKPAAYVSKISPEGNLFWAKQMGFPGDWGLAYGNAITLDNNQNVISAGYFIGRVDFDPGPGTCNLSLSGGGYDGYIQKLDNNGNFIWAKQLCGSSQEYYSDITTDGSGNIYAAGSYGGTADFNPDKKLKYNLAAFGSNDIFYQKLTPEGAFAWAKHIGGTGSEVCYVIHFDPSGSGSLYITGLLAGEGDYDPGPGTLIFTPVGSYDAYLEKLDLDGNMLWAKQIAGASWDIGADIATDTDGNVYMVGYFYGTADFNDDPGNDYLMTSEGADDIFITKMGAAGEFMWAEHLGGPGYDGALTLAIDNTGDLFIGANFQETVDFNPDGDEVFLLTGTSISDGRDMSVIKLNPNGGDGCLVPYGLTVEGETLNTALISWAPVEGVSNYYIRYREMATETWTVIGPLDVTTIELNNLTEATSYEFQVKTNCQSNYSYSLEFATLGAPCTDIYEPNNSMATAVQIQAGNDYFGLIDIISDYDWFKINTGNAAKNLMVVLSDLPANYNIQLRKGDGTILSSSSNSGTMNDTVIYNSRQAGLYYIHIYGFDGAFNPNDCYQLNAYVSSTQYSKSEPAESVFEEFDNQLTVYPNPSNSTFNFIYNTNTQEPITLQLFDISGRMVQEIRSLPPNELITAGADLDYGIYVAVVSQGTVKKFVKIAKVE